VKTLSILVVALCAATLSGCSSAQNEAPCKDFEATYNAVDPRDKLRLNDPSGKDFEHSLKKLAETADAGSAKASGDVQAHLQSIVLQQTRYARTATESNLPYDILDVRVQLDTARDALVDACKASGYPIQLEPNHPNK
jgi:hypothetical protein